MARTRTASKPKQQVVEAEEPSGLEKLPPPKRANLPKTSDLPKGWSPSAQVIDSVRAIRSIFPDFNRGTRVGGVPLSRIITVHGQTHGGKSAFVIGLLKSFIDAGHYGGLIDAEHATAKQFLEQLMGRALTEIPNLLADRPSSYEETITKTDAFLKWVGDKVKLDPSVCSILVVDSINKLVPERELEALKKSGDDIDKGWGRGRANMNQAWLDHLVPLLAAANCTLVLIAQEREEKNAKPWDIPTVKGGKAVLYDASLICRVSKAEPLRDGPDKDSPIIGFRHRCRIWKSKVGSMDGFHTDVAFHMSNGKLVPPGFDTARDVLHVARALEIIETSGSWLSWGKRRWQGEKKAHYAIAHDEELRDALLVAINKIIDAKVIRDASVTGGH